MANRNKARGTAFESAIRDYLNATFGWETYRPAQAGREDTGDIHGLPISAIIQAKNQSRMTLAEWVDDALEQAGHAGRRWGVVVHKRRGKNVAQSYVTMPLEVFADIVTQLTKHT